MARPAARYVCQDCGAVFGKWQGRCESCGAWNTVIEETPRERTPRGLGGARGRPVALHALDGAPEESPRLATGIAELDRVVGGGFVAGSTILLAGDPGIGKSTLLLQALVRLGAVGHSCLYVSGEEAVDQVRVRARRLGLADAGVRLAAATDMRDILATLESDSAAVVVVDSIQTMYLDTLDSAPGTVAQVRAAANEIIRHAKRTGTICILVGHVTKEGMIAGPRVLEHMVDAVLSFEGERGHQFRVLRTVKNRFGATEEIGVFEMTDGGLTEVSNPSALFLSDREAPVSGAAVFAGIEGTRPVLVEIQALVANTTFASPRRAVVGWDTGRLAMILAVLEARCGLSFSTRDVYLSVAGGLRVAEPAADLAAAAALVSAHLDTPAPADTVFFGEIGLTGEVRPVGRLEARLREAAKLGFSRAVVPPAKKGGTSGGKRIMVCAEIAHLRDLAELLGAE